MYNYIRAYNIGYNEGIKSAYYDFKKCNIKKYNKFNDSIVISKLYDIGYIDGYNKTIKYLKKNFYL